MRTLKIHLVRARDVLCFGPQGIEVHFSDYGQVVSVRGINLDNPYSEEDPDASSNAAGKSSLQEILSIGFYGKMVKSPTKNRGGDIINVLAEKGEVEIQWDDYRLVRGFKRQKNGSVTGTLKVWKSDHKIWDKATELDRGKDDLEDEIRRAIGLSHHAFCNVVIFDDSNTYSFLEADAATKREIVENLLGLDQYREYHQNAKDQLKDLKQKQDHLTREYTRSQDEAAAAERRVTTAKQQETTWKIQKAEQAQVLAKRIQAKQQQLKELSDGDQWAMWEAAQDGIAKLNDEIIDLESKRKRLDEILTTAREKVEVVRTERQTIKEAISEQNIALQTAKADLEKATKLIGKLEGLKEGADCPYCHGVISHANHGHVLENARAEADQHRQAMATITAAIAVDKEKYDKKVASIAVMEEKIREAEGKVSVLDAKVRKNRTEITDLSALPKPEGNAAQQVLEAEIVELKKQLNAKNEECSGDSPYTEIIAQAEKEKAQREKDRDEKAAALQAVEDEVPYYQFWVEAFGDKGIRKFVIDGIIPALNERVAYWMQILIEGKLELTFDNTLQETIIRNGNPAKYHAMSNGERRRVNLAVSQAFAYVMMLNSGSCPSIVFLDEITGGGIDRAGVSGIYNMIFELAKERQVFVTTHNENLMNLMQGCETITLKKQNDITVLVS